MQREFAAMLDSNGQLSQAMSAKDRRRHWANWRENMAKQSDLAAKFKLLPEIAQSDLLPQLSFVLHIPFRLQKSYISKDERDFYPLDNPLRREKVFQVPLVAATSWKGALRATLWQLGYKETHESTLRLLGNSRDSEEGQAGRTFFYATFFEQIGLEVINPHDRTTGIGKQPILMECVPQKANGALVFLYVPFGPPDQIEGGGRAELARDLEVLTEGIQAMLTTYGFGAKTSSGFGIAEDQLVGKGTLALRVELPGIRMLTGALPESAQPVPSLPRYQESPMRLHSDFRQPDGSLKSETEYESFIKNRGGQYAKKDKQLYEKAQKWWEREGRQLAEAKAQEPMPEPASTSTQRPPVTELTFATLSEMRELAQRVAAQLRNGSNG